MNEPARDESPDSHRWRARLTAALSPPGDANDVAPRLPATDIPVRPAAVLIPVVGDSEPFVYFTRRSDSLRHHAGQISFPGGRVEARDTSIRAAALREAQEEIGLHPAAVQVLGELPPYRTGTGFVITPFVGWVAPGTTVLADGREVAHLFGVPLIHALDHRQFRLHRRERDGREYDVYSIDYDGHHIWGATAGILYDLLQRLAHAENRDIGRPPMA